jgi:2,3-bisphosphoglycerate-dependent phosphoglycerate mutase
MKSVARLTLLRHGESEWNRDKRFTGWADVELTTRGRQQAVRAGRLLKARGFVLDLCVTSCLRRAIETAKIVLETMGLSNIRMVESWMLNERHYGALQGMSHREAIERFGLRQVLAWQRHYADRPPLLEPGDERLPDHDPGYAMLAASELPRGESLKDTIARVLPAWEHLIAPEIRRGARVLVVAHGNTLRGLLKYLDNVPEGDVPLLHVPTAEPLIYELDESGQPLGHYYLRRRSRLLDRALGAFRAARSAS